MAFESEIVTEMFANGGAGRSQNGNNCVKSEPRSSTTDWHSHINQPNRSYQSTTTKSSFIKRFNPFSKSKSQTISCNSEYESCNDKEFASVKVLKQFWNDQIKTAKSTEHLNCKQKSATIKYFSQSNEHLNDQTHSTCNERSKTLDGRLPIEEFNKFKDASFVRNRKSQFKYIADINASLINTSSDSRRTKYTKTDSFTLYDNKFLQVSTIGDKLRWVKRSDLQQQSKDMSVKLNMDADSSSESCSKNAQKDNSSRRTNYDTKKESNASSVGSISSSVSSHTNSTSRKLSFKSTPSTTVTYMNKKIASNGNKVAQIAQRFNQIIQQDATILDEVKKRGTVVLHRSGGCVFKIREEKVDSRKPMSYKRPVDDTSDDAKSLPSIGKNSTRKKSSLKKRPSIRVLVESPRKEERNGNVLLKKQLYETNIVNKETIVLKPKIPDKSERVLAKTKELKSKRINKIEKTDTTSLVQEPHVPAANHREETPEIAAVDTAEPVYLSLKDHKKTNFQKIYDKITFRPTFLYGKKSSKLVSTAEAASNTVDKVPVLNHDDILKEAEDDMEFQAIDLNLNVFFQNENLSESHKVDDNGNLTNQEFDETPEECKHEILTGDMKPNESFLFRTQTSCKFETACDAFIRDMLSEPAEESLLLEKESSDCFASKTTNRVITESSETDKLDVVAGENIYQSLCEVKGETDSVKSYESFGNYDEIGQNILDNTISLSDLVEADDDYIFPESAPEPPPPRKNTVPKISSPILTSTTSMLVQNDMQIPKLCDLRKSNSCVSSTYEKIKYDQLPRSNQQPYAKLELPPRNDQQLSREDENIYDTIKNGDNRSLISVNDVITFKADKTVEPDGMSESFSSGDENPYKNSKNDTMSIISNCYESISLKQNYSTINQILKHAISTTTLSSEHRINSIYGTMVGQSLTPPSDRSASDHSDEWIDLSDEENDLENTPSDRFIV